ncbi:MAG: hypothetical protein ACFFCV_03795 [Promethearchaeota archaeon]
MTETEISSIFEITDIAEINSLSLNEYGTSINNYFGDKQNSDLYKRYYEWFDHSKFEKINTTFLKEFNKSFQDFFQKFEI